MKIAYIKNCSRCPHCAPDQNSSHLLCLKKKYRHIRWDRPQNDNDPIPGWCPLEDVIRDPRDTEELIEMILNWWDDAQYWTEGYCGERNVFNEDPDFIQKALEIKDKHNSN